ncbi:hypothetical protein [Nocardia crassostreae]|uniref:hypothetical protein n=1 Tax=Nocardia crassostreae TaxID=53428 RepID=UPI0008304E6A|nr:hypothetical protein [Nocardia crassostreae]
MSGTPSHSADHEHGHGHGDPPADDGTLGKHGMLVFGTVSTTYLSHLPMFMSPHNFQVVLEVGLDDRSADALAADRERGFTGIHTSDPADFQMSELDPRDGGPVRKTVPGTLVRGHFERGGEVIVRNAVATVRAVVHFADVALDEPPSGRRLTYQCFGRAGELFLLHDILGRPNFDQVLAIRLEPGTVTNPMGDPLPDDVALIGFDHAVPVVLGQREFTGDRLAEGETEFASFPASSPPSMTHGFGVRLTVEREIYIEFNDLK